MAGVYTIPPDRFFVDSLARGVLTEAGDTPQALLDYTILLPTRRACRALRDAFLRASDGTALLLPAMRPLDRKSTRLNSSHSQQSRMPSSA